MTDMLRGMGSVRRRWLFLICGWLGCVMLFYISPNAGEWLNRFKVWEPRPGAFQTEDILQYRRKLLQEKCNENLTRRYFRVRSPLFFYSRPGNLLACKAPKTGSTFWGMIVLALQTKETSKMFHTSRNAIHGKTEVPFNAIPAIMQGTTPRPFVIMASRDPYHRLYSVFIDKYYLLGLLGRSITKALNRKLNRINDGYCGYNITFQDYLDYVVGQAFSGALMNEHYAPVSELCDVCHTQYDIVCSQETLMTDTKFLLNKLRIDSSKRKSILNDLNKNGIRDLIYSLVKSYAGDYKTYYPDCPNPVLLFARTWNTLKYQGYILSTTPFPEETFKSFKYHTEEAENITTIIMDVMATENMTPAMRVEQRRKAMAQAYQEIKQYTLLSIQEVYHRDFELFGYSKEPPQL